MVKDSTFQAKLIRCFQGNNLADVMEQGGYHGKVLHLWVELGEVLDHLRAFQAVLQEAAGYAMVMASAGRQPDEGQGEGVLGKYTIYEVHQVFV